MWKLPSPSVVCAKNSPVTFTSGFTRRRSTSISSMRSCAAVEGAHRLLPPDVIVDLAERVGPLLGELVRVNFFRQPRRQPFLSAIELALPHVGLELGHHFFEDAFGLVR